MAVWFVSRHPGAEDWMRSQGIAVDRWVSHLSVDEIVAGDIVMGILPVNLASVVCARGARYFNLSLDLPFAERGKELNMADLIAAGARLEEYSVSLV
jgi:CRISPR-associated protein Csx16